MPRFQCGSTWRLSARQAEGIALQTPGQHSDGDHQQQPINPLGIPQAAAGQLEHPGLLIAQQLFAAEAPALAPDPGLIQSLSMG
jgi:hypothetical protein